MTVSYSDVQGARSSALVGAGCSLIWGNGNIDDEVLFVDRDGPDDDPATCGDNDYHLQSGSACINGGDPYYVPDLGETDIDGDPRLSNQRMDMGADEVELASPVIAGWSSVADHGGIELPLWLVHGGGATCEPRGPGLSKLEVVFDEPMDPNTIGPGVVSVMSLNHGDVSEQVANVLLDGTGTVMAMQFDPALPDQERYTVTIEDTVTDLAGNALGFDRDVEMRMLIGDVNGDAIINPLDLGAVRAMFAEDITVGGNARYDINCDGVINALDLSLCRMMFRHTAP